VEIKRGGGKVIPDSGICTSKGAMAQSSAHEEDLK